MRKFISTILSICTLTALSCATAASVVTKNVRLTAADEATPIASETLLAPTSYEQYLQLTAPTDVAANDHYVTVSEASIIYVFSRETGAWQQYSHSERITKLGFGSRDALYFLDGRNTLYLLDLAAQTPTATDTGVVCSTFSIRGDSLYFVNTSGSTTSISQSQLSAPTAATELFTERMYAPALSFWNGEIYYVYGTEYLRKLHPETGADSSVATLPSGVNAMLIAEGVLFCTTSDGGFYGYELATLAETGSTENCTPVVEAKDEYAALSANGEDIYVTDGNTVRLYSLADKAFKPYEVGGASDSLHRFDGASTLLLSGERLLVADNGNDRISVYDTQAQAFTSPIASDVDATFLAAYGDTVLSADQTQAVIYSLGESDYGAIVASLPTAEVRGAIVGATCVYGNYYVLTDSNYCYTLTVNGAETPVWKETVRKTHYGEAMTSDVNGNIYLLNGGAVYRYEEANFNSATETGVKICEDLSTATLSIAVDYAGSVYALAEDAVSRYSAAENGGMHALQAVYSITTPLVYGVTPHALAVTFGVEENQAYVLYAENYLGVTTAWDLPTVKTIPTENSVTEIFAQGNGTFTAVETKPNALLVEFDLNTAQGQEVFPYLRYYRSGNALSALKIGETQNHAVLCYRTETGETATCFVAKSQLTEIPESEYLVRYENARTGYLTNGAQVYKYPNSALTANGAVERGEEVKLIGELRVLDKEYYAVEYGTGGLGYIPKAYVTLFDGTPPSVTVEEYGEKGNGAEDIWRLVYLILGGAAICVLIDFLILRKPDHDKDNP